MNNKAKINKKYPFRQMQPGETFKLDDADVRRAQKIAWYYRTRCKRPIRIVIAKSDTVITVDGSAESYGLPCVSAVMALPARNRLR